MRTVLHTLISSAFSRVVLALLLAGGTASTAFAQTVTYFHNDVAGTPQMATNVTGAVLWRENYLPYGYRQVAEPASTANKLWFTGKPYDPDTQLSYMGARYYMPLLGRFTGIDPVEVVAELPFSINRYAYANNNPYRYVDPDGRFAVPLALKVFTAGTALVVGTTVALSPEKRNQIALRADQAARSAANSLIDFSNWVFNEEAETPKLPTGIVGDQSAPNAGPNKRGGRWTSGALTPENGGTGDYQKDLDKLTGGTRPWQDGDKAKPGSQVGPNGIFGRDVNGSGGKSIDIPANGTKPHETLHYP